MRIYTVEEAAQIARVNEGDILDAVRTGELSSYLEPEPRFPVPYTRRSVTHRALIGICADTLDRIQDVDLEHRWQCVLNLHDAEDENAARGQVERALLAWYGAALDDPKDREAAGMIQGLEAFAGYLGLLRDGSIHKPLEASELRVVG